MDVVAIDVIGVDTLTLTYCSDRKKILVHASLNFFHRNRMDLVNQNWPKH